MFQYSQRVLQPTIRVPSQIQQSIITTTFENHPQLQSTRKVQQNIDPTALNTSPIKIVNNKTPLSPNIIVYSQNPYSITPQQIPSNIRQNLTPTKHLNANMPQQRNLTPTRIIRDGDQTSKNKHSTKSKVQADFGTPSPIQQQMDKDDAEFLNEKQQSYYNNLQELLIQSEFKLSQLEQKSRQIQEQRKRLQQQFISKSPKLGALL
ncbi:unnamed protein product (macronuclear) [Paramecium tetraurelia]|uniref:Uncharacterized protein n=1 Tax=Paramecium tetraurelia TaxID=5888 RepID=A0DA87_PARTE|nr:uncharacterized protein GSPATT00014861001 [Paramecium tetraurelia]CAK79954.1 unnamed protein product [Paramecium tetraurelia]|eukprot:XP_001447351.1 hypothetical protein (macronuclear) [Paramecium tetraurelia strain d4-2]